MKAVESVLLFGFNNLDNKFSRRRVREFGMVIAPKNFARVEVFLKDIIDFRLENELAFRSWKASRYDNEMELEIISGMETNKKYEGLGIGTALLLSGENVMELIAKKIAHRYNLDSIKSTISDGSLNGWTSKQMSQLKEYNYVGTASYKKMILP